MVGEIRLPADVAGVVIADQHCPLGQRQPDQRGPDRAIGRERAPRAIATEYVRPRVGRIRENAQDAPVRQPAPANLARPGSAVRAPRKASLGERPHHAVGRSRRGERREDIADRRLDPLVRIQHRRTGLVVDIPDRKREAQGPTPCGRLLGSVQASGQQMQLRLRHRALQPQQQPIVELRQIVGPVAVDDQRVAHAAELEQPLQIRRTSRQP